MLRTTTSSQCHVSPTFLPPPVHAGETSVREGDGHTPSTLEGDGHTWTLHSVGTLQGRVSSESQRHNKHHTKTEDAQRVED